MSDPSSSQEQPHLRRPRKRRRVVGLLAAAVLVAAVPGLVLAQRSSSGSSPARKSTGAAAATAPASSAPVVAAEPTYYLALGDSLAMGVGATVDAHDYVNLIYQHEAPRYGALRVRNLGCGGATTKSMLYGPGCGPGTQIGNAEAFLRSNLGHLAFVTIDIGGNDLIACIDGPAVNPQCVETAFRAVAAFLPKILARLHAAYPGVRVYGMNYYDPYLADWVQGIAGENMAEETVDVVGELNTELSKVYAAAGVPVADPFTAFRTPNFKLTGTYNGERVPQNVAEVCRLTLMCSARNVHTNDAGHAVLAGTFEAPLDRDLAGPLTLTTSALPAASTGHRYGAALAATGGLSPLRWRVQDGTMPPGLALSADTGVIAGTPSAAGTYTFTIQLSDAAQPAHTAGRPLSIVVH